MMERVLHFSTLPIRMILIFKYFLSPLASLNSKCRNLMRKLGINIVVVFVLLWLFITLLVIFSNLFVLVKYYKREVHITTKVNVDVITVNPIETILKTLNMFTTYSFNDCQLPTTVNYFDDNNTNKTSNKSIYTIKPTKCLGSYTLVILVTSNITNFERRSLIRQSWGNHIRSWHNKKMHNAKIYFLVGRPPKGSNAEFTNTNTRNLLCESEMFRDLVFVDVHEHHSNITSKMKHGFKWVLRSCTFQYLLSVNDDVYVNVPLLFNFLFDSETPRKGLFAGNVQFSTRVLRTGKYGVPKNVLHKDVYARYCSGGGFVLSRDSLALMVTRFNRVKLFSVYDAYFGEVALASGLDLYHNEYFRTFEKVGSCKYDSHLILLHPVTKATCMTSLLARQILDKRKNEQE